MALAASARVTTEQELKLPVARLVVVDATEALVVDAALDDVVVVVEEEPHAATRMVAGTATTITRTSGRSLIRPLDPIARRRYAGAYWMASGTGLEKLPAPEA